MSLQTAFNVDENDNERGYIDAAKIKVIGFCHLATKPVEDAIREAVRQTDSLLSHYFQNPLQKVLEEHKDGLVHWDGEPYHLVSVDQVFALDEGRWMRWFLNTKPNSEHSWRPVERLLKLQYLALYIQITNPELARTFTQ